MDALLPLPPLALGSRNRAKRLAVRAATGIEPLCVAVQSGVAEQPLSAGETLRGAIVRARAAQAALPAGGIGLGLEGGVDFDAAGTCRWHLLSVCAAWDGRTLHTAHGVHMPLPDAIGAQLAAGADLAAVMDALFARHGSNQDEGAYGLLSAGALTRAGVFRDAVIAVLLPWRQDAFCMRRAN